MSSPHSAWNHLYEDGLALAGFACVAFKAFTKARGVVADSAAGAVTAFEAAKCSTTGNRIRVRRALNERAISTTETVIAPATHLGLSIPVRGVRG